MITVKNEKKIKHFNKNLMMSAEEEERFQLPNNCWTCDKLFDVEDDKVRDHCHIIEINIEVQHIGFVILILN